MRKISRKHIAVNYIKDSIVTKPNLNFYLVSFENIKSFQLTRVQNILMYKKSLYKYLLAGKFSNNIKSYFKSHTYINFELNKNLIQSLINDKNIILFQYNTNIFLNNLDILRNNKKTTNFVKVYDCILYKLFFFICLLSYTDYTD